MTLSAKEKRARKISTLKRDKIYSVELVTEEIKNRDGSIKNFFRSRITTGITEHTISSFKNGAPVDSINHLLNLKHGFLALS